MFLIPVIFALLVLAPAPQVSREAPADGLPYRVEPLVVENGDVKLGGTLSRPTGSTPVPAVVLITGSGAQNRDQDVFGFKVFAVLADALTRKGIAVYRHDDRGVGESTGRLASSTTEDFAGDALAAVARLKTMPGIDPKRVGLLGHSEGAMAAAIAAARSSDVAFIVMLAGTAVPGDQVLRQQARDISIALGATPEQAERIVTAHRAVTEAILTGAPADEQARLVRALVEAQVDAAPAAQVEALGDRSAFIDQAVKAGTTQMSSPWMKFMLRFDPVTALEKVSVPVYAAMGELDTQVPPSLHEKPLREGLLKNTRVRIVTYPSANHLFQQAKTGQVNEYPTLDKSFVPGLMDEVAAWILTQR